MERHAAAQVIPTDDARGGTVGSMSPDVIPVLRYRDPAAAIDFLVDALEFERHAVHEDPSGTIVHAELRRGDGIVMLGSARDGDDAFATSRAVVYVIVDDAGAAHARAVEAGAEITQPLIDQDYGSREFAVTDPEGNVWSLGTYRPE
jgi:uncharacterized glyoxalase superfamily protein PhnB